MAETYLKASSIALNEAEFAAANDFKRTSKGQRDGKLDRKRGGKHDGEGDCNYDGECDGKRDPECSRKRHRECECKSQLQKLVQCQVP